MTKNSKYRYSQSLKLSVRALQNRSAPKYPPRDAIEKVLQAGRETQQPLWQKVLPAIRRTAAIVAIALVIFGAILSWLKINHPSTAFARIVEPLLQARSATCHAIFRMAGLPEIEAEVFYKDTGKLRLELDTGLNYLVDAGDAYMVGMMPKYKTAMEIDFDPMPQAPVPQLVTGWVFELRRQIEIAQKNNLKKVVYLGLTELDGIAVHKYQLWNPQSKIFIWADKDTLILRRMQITIEPITGCLCVLDLVNFGFDTLLDDRLFDTRIPDDYIVQKVTLNASEPSEADLLEALKTFTDLTGGYYPDSLTALGLHQTARRYTPRQLLWQVITLKPQTPGMSELLTFIVTQARGLIFFQSLPDVCDAHYIGQDVSVNDPDRIIFYYRPVSKDTYRIIYADLTVEEVHPDNLAEIIP
ncbi:MAG: hypothetical protein JW709_07980 [Sedimentisphaerales bacterium]|nr:hypothetical protein [Sedimentisphaerales bacterium]